MEPYYDKAEKAIGSTHRHGRPPLPANNNYKVFANGAENVGYKFYATGPYGTNAEPYDGRPGSIQDGFNFQGDKNTSKWSTAVREIPRITAKCPSFIVIILTFKLEGMGALFLLNFEGR